MVTIGEKYVERAQKAIVETVILKELTTNDGLTLDALVMRVRTIGSFDEKVDADFVEDCVSRLDRDGHVEENDDVYRITDDGREDVQKMEPILRNVTSAWTSGGTGRATTSTSPGARSSR